MPDDKDQEIEASPEPPKKPAIVDPFAKLTDDDWREAMMRGQVVADARDERIGAAIRRGCENSINVARQELDQAELALRTYLGRPDSEPEDRPRHRCLAEDLKNATDRLKNATDEYAALVANRPGAR